MAETRKTPVADPAYNPANPLTRQQMLDNTPTGTISVTYTPLPGDPDTTEAYGRTFNEGEAVKLPAHMRAKVEGNPSFSIDGKKSLVREEADKEEPEEQEPATFEENLARERAQEYLQDTRSFPNLSPGDADRVARAQEQARELQEAVNSEDNDKPRRGRPPKAK